MSNVPANLNSSLIEKPAYLQNLPEDDTSDMRKHMSPPRLKFIQNLTEAPYKPPFKDGDLIIIPSMVKVADLETECTIVPIHFFTHFVCLNPHAMKNQLPYVREQTKDENHPIAKKAKAFVSEPCPENSSEKIIYRQVLNFLVRIVGDSEDLPKDPVALSLMKGEFNSGRILIQLIENRRAPRYVCQFNMISALHPGKKGKWFGPNFRNSPEPWVPEHLVQQYQAEHEAFKKIVEEGRMNIDLDDSDVEKGDASDESRF